MQYHWQKHTLQFHRPSGTSRGILNTKDSWFIVVQNPEWEYPALGECSIIEGLSPDAISDIENVLDEVCKALSNNEPIDINHFPAITFASEMLAWDIAAKGTKEFGETPFTQGEDQIPINGLIWMGEPSFMLAQLEEKISQGFHCLKLKIGAIDFDEELSILRAVRNEFGVNELELRVDANGAFNPNQAIDKLNRLSEFKLHSIEQPIAAGQWEEMARLCEQTPIDIALDEELIGVQKTESRKALLDEIKPQYIILKPSLVGGIKSSDEWIHLAEERDIGWWITSALESNIGLNAIAQYAYSKSVSMPQGLGTGGLFTNNLDSPLYIQRQFLKMNPNHIWNLKPLNL